MVVANEKMKVEQNQPEDLSLLITGFTSKAQINAFIDWYQMQGEQQINLWLAFRKFEIHKNKFNKNDEETNCNSMNTDIEKTYPIQFDKKQGHMVIHPS